VVAKLAIEIKPDTAGPTAKITVDDQEVAGQEIDIPMDASVPKKKVKVKIRALGFRDLESTFDVAIGENSMHTELIKGKSSLPANGAAVAATPDAATPPKADAPKADAPKATPDAPKTTPEVKTAPRNPNPNPTPKPKPKPKGGLIDI